MRDESTNEADRVGAAEIKVNSTPHESTMLALKTANNQGRLVPYFLLRSSGVKYGTHRPFAVAVLRVGSANKLPDYPVGISTLKRPDALQSTACA